MDKEARATAKKKLAGMARKKLVDDGMHGTGKSDPTKNHAAKPLGDRLYQVG